MATLRIHLAHEWISQSDSPYAEGPIFRVYRGAEDPRPWHVHVLLDRSDIYSLDNGIEVQGQSVSPLIKQAVLRYAVQRIEQGIREGFIPTPQSVKTDTLFIESAETSALRQLLQEKTCTYQLQDGRDFLCSAASPEDSTLRGRIGFRAVAPTSRAICRKCSLPNTDYLCSHFLHPSVWAVIDSGRLLGRQLEGTGGICDLGKDEIRRPTQCHAGGHECWERVVETEDEPLPILASPLTLPEAFDFLDTAWRLAFGKKQALLRLQSTASTASLALSCATRSEFESRLSALADILKAMEIPDDFLPQDAPTIDKGQTFTRLLACLKPKLEEVDYQAIEHAVSTLRAVNDVRVGLQHSGASRRLPEELRKLGIPYPPQWGDAWDRVRAKTYEALHIIREKVLKYATEPSNA